MHTFLKLRGARWLNRRLARWVVLAVALPVLWACNARRLVKPTPAPEQAVNELFQQSVNRNIDIVFGVDDSSSMTDVQNKLIVLQFPGVHERALVLPRRPAERPHRCRVFVDGRGPQSVDRPLPPRGRPGNVPFEAARADVRRRDAQRRSKLHHQQQRNGELHRRHLGCLHVHRAARRKRLRLRAPVRIGAARAGRRRRPWPSSERRLPAPGRLSGRRPPHERGRLFGATRLGSLRLVVAARVRSARAAAVLSLQRVWPPVRGGKPRAPHFRPSTRPWICPGPVCRPRMAGSCA